MKRARFEVYKFAQSCLGASEKHQSNVELAVKLGARPPKKKSVNYKELIKINKSTLEENKKQDIIVRMGKQFTTKGKKETKKQSLKRKKRVGDGILNVYGKVGNFLFLDVNY
ncbi:hypothetical protein AAG570_008821 [Ranatra chinensis]|uniref:Uncharacterized protein n=1 Tax=Ranatra chinensis TaxID=642074 RepID=A0ABD0YS05_9HEMI